MNALAFKKLSDRRAGFQKEICKLSLARSERDKAFDRLATAMNRGSVARLTEVDVDRARKSAEIIGGTTKELVTHFTSPSKMNRDECFRDVVEIVRAHQKGVGTLLSETFKKKVGLTGASARLGKIIRKAKNPSDLTKVLANLPSRLTEKDLKGGGTKAVKSQQNEAARKKGFQRN